MIRGFDHLKIVVTYNEGEVLIEKYTKRLPEDEWVLLDSSKDKESRSYSVFINQVIRSKRPKKLKKKEGNN